MNTNAKAPTPLEAFNLFVQLAKLPELRLNLQEHTNIQIALEVLKPLVESHGAQKEAKLTVVPEPVTV